MFDHRNDADEAYAPAQLAKTAILSSSNEESDCEQSDDGAADIVNEMNGGGSEGDIYTEDDNINTEETVSICTISIK